MCIGYNGKRRIHQKGWKFGRSSFRRKNCIRKKSIFNWLECDPTYVIYQVHNSFVIKKNIIIFF